MKNLELIAQPSPQILVKTIYLDVFFIAITKQDLKNEFFC